MKIKIIDQPYSKVISKKVNKRKKPIRPNMFFRILLKGVSLPDMLKTRFKLEKVGMEKLGKKEPCLFLMNHSSFIDMEIAVSSLFPRAFNIVTTYDAFIGKDLLMHLIGCIPASKYMSDPAMVRDTLYAVKKLNNSVLLFPEAGYSFDGTATPIPDTVGRYVKMLGIPVVMIRTYGAFSRDPLYNNLQIRKVPVSAKMEYIFSADQVEALSAVEIQTKLNQLFTFDNFAWQQENNIVIDEDFRADGLNRVLYKCPHCLAEGQTEGKGVKLICHSCKKEYTLTPLGRLEAVEGESAFTQVADWYAWERECVRREIEEGKYSVSLPADICMTVDLKKFYRVGKGRLSHSLKGFALEGCDGELSYTQSPTASYSLFSDFNWYEIGDLVCIGNSKTLYYCFPETEGDIVAKMRLATEETYKLEMAKKRSKVTLTKQEASPSDDQ